MPPKAGRHPDTIDLRWAAEQERRCHAQRDSVLIARLPSGAGVWHTTKTACGDCPWWRPAFGEVNALYRGFALSKLRAVLETGLDVPPQAAFFASGYATKAWEYPPQRTVAAMLVFDQDHTARSSVTTQAAPLPADEALYPHQYTDGATQIRTLGSARIWGNFELAAWVECAPGVLGPVAAVQAAALDHISAHLRRAGEGVRVLWAFDLLHHEWTCLGFPRPAFDPADLVCFGPSLPAPVIAEVDALFASHPLDDFGWGEWKRCSPCRQAMDRTPPPRGTGCPATPPHGSLKSTIRSARSRSECSRLARRFPVRSTAATAAITVLGYARVSTAHQNAYMQVQALKAAGAERIWAETLTGGRAQQLTN